ncbi:MAG TPA: DUF2294 domain-containing protein [Solirubrobacteraceae bacterium]|jgi:uncharacterized protein YbcI|nr:DUF2294 domain-containing protein [Solirubrobacteraceae bacterium]
MPEPHHDMPAPEAPLPEQPPEALTAVDMSGEADIERRGDQRAKISNAMVALKKRFYGKGPERARSYLVDEYVFCAMEGGLTRNEEVLVEAGQEDAVRQYRLLFQETMTKTTTEAIEQITGRRVVGYHSQITFRPTRAFEIFVLET